ncbi:MAG: Gfo/Idh/MocA family oxidoreductase [Clostridia bacterium]|nr:Gfo/Idh/MocA family oxidoreductase [Clostridia bacterium]
MSKIKVAIIGVGGISKHHINSYIANPNVELYAFCDINEKVLRAKGETYGIERLYTDEATMLRELPEIDAVSVCTWNSAHAPCTIMALEAGKHVLCEKPMATNAEDAMKMLETAKRVGKKLMVGFVRRFGKDTKVIRDFMDAGSVGELYYAKASYLRRNGCPGGWFGDKSRSGGGPLIDLGVHVIDLVRYLCGNPKPVSVTGATYKKLGNRPDIKDSVEYKSVSKTSKDIFDVEDLATAFIRFDNGAVLAIDTSFSLNLKHNTTKIELFGTKGGIYLDGDVELYTETGGYLSNVTLDMKTAFEMKDIFQNEINFYVDAIINDTDTYAIAEDGITLMKILDGIYKSAELGCEVKIV